MHEKLDAKLQAIIERYEGLEKSLAEQDVDPATFAKLSQEYAKLTPLVQLIRKLRALSCEFAEASVLKNDSNPEMSALAEQECLTLAEEIESQRLAIRVLLLPQDAVDSKNAILEVRAGTGGEEAALFAGDLFRMYQRYAAHRGWRVEILGLSESDHKGVKDASLSITGENVFARLKFEAGVHRVQRVPVTEASGRIHTSAATVAVLPEAEEVDIHIDEKDLRVDVFRSSGPGGQSVNTTDSAVRLTHLPTGIVVQQQDEKSQHKNKEKAMKVLRARLYEKFREEEEAKRSASRKGQVGSGDRSERIRTYNFPQRRVTDHRIGLTLHKLEQVLEGSALDEIIEALIADDQARRLSLSEQND